MRAFWVGTEVPGISVRIEGLEIVGGRAPDGADGAAEQTLPVETPATSGLPGAGGGAILNFAEDLRLIDVRLRENRAGDGGDGGDSHPAAGLPGSGGAGGNGGAIHNLGGLALERVELIDNAAGDGGQGGLGFTFGGLSGQGGSGGAIHNQGELVVRRSTFAGNRAGDGADGVASTTGGSGATGGSGGAILNDGSAAVTNSTFFGNRAGHGGSGAGITLGGNGGDGGDGGALAGAPGSVAEVAATTLAGNSAGLGGLSGGGIPPLGTAGVDGAGGGLSSAGTATVGGSILANLGGAAANCGPGVVDGGANLAFPTAGGCGGVSIGDPKLDPGGLALNGGPTPTLALLEGSAAIDLVPIGACTDAEGKLLTEDQRGAVRPQRSACDAGAYEAAAPPPAPPATRAPQSGAAPLVEKPPRPRIRKKPKRVVRTKGKRARVVFRFGAPGRGLRFQCRLDRQRFKLCRSPKVYRLQPGKHRFRVRAVRGKVAGPATKPVKFRVVKARKP